MTSPVQYGYGNHERVPPGTPCLPCGTKTDWPVMDHCHKHGWVRGVLCNRCNMLMKSIDRRLSPRADSIVHPLTLPALLAHRDRCPDCEPITAEDLGLHPEARLALRIEPGLRAPIEAIAKALDRSVSWVVCDALRRYAEQEHEG